MRFLRPLLGLGLLVGLAWLAEPQALLHSFRQADLRLFGAALTIAILANLICVYRWKLVARMLGIRASFGFLLSAYAQGISVNSVLPGGIVGGDAWRSLAISRKAADGEKQQGVLSVLLERVSGFWGLAWLSLSAGFAVTLMSKPESQSAIWGFASPLGQAYLLALLLIAVAPMLSQLVHAAWVRRHTSQRQGQELGCWTRTLFQLINALPILRETLVISIMVQLLSATALWLCLRSVEVNLSWALLTALCGGIFLSGILPATLGGFGARELGAMAFITPFGFAKEAVLAGSVLFGLTATVQGILGLWFWFRDREAERAPVA
jgi:glycosyltransferase 2 family protein